MNTKIQNITLKPKGKGFILNKAVYYEDFIAPKGMFTDLGSIPPIFRPILSRFGKAIRGYIIHDALYVYQPCTRKEADVTLKTILKEDGVGWFKRGLIYRGVRIGGWIYWRKRKKQLR